MSQVLKDVHNGVLHVLLKRPERKNAINNGMYTELAEAIEAAASDDEVRVIVISGAEGCFTAGNDLDEFIEQPPRDAAAPVFRFLRALAALSKPVVGSVEGLAIGIGTTMLLHFDLVYAAANARFALPFTGLGLVPEAASSYLLPRLIGHQRAAERLLLGDAFSADEAASMGLVNRVLPQGEVLAHAMSQAARLAALPQGSVTGTKILMKGLRTPRGQGGHRDLLSHMEDEIRLFVRRVGGPANVEAISAFRERRKPDFAGMA